MRDPNSKIKKLAEVLPIVAKLKSAGKKIVLGHGVFDLMHYGHIHYLKQAKQVGDILLVSMKTDRFIQKGPYSPAFNERIRAASLAALECVDYVIPCNEDGPYQIIKKLKPHLYVKGEDSMDQLKNPKSALHIDQKLVKSVGGAFYFTKSLPIHSTELIRKYYNILPQNVVNFLSVFKKSYPLEDVLSQLQQLKKLKVLVIGEAIIDEYRYVTPLGKPPKANIISAHFLDEEAFAGGALACANHIASICDNVDLVTYLGEKDSKEKFIRRQLRPSINPKFFYCPDRPTIVKRRYVDRAYYSKIFEEYVFNKDHLPSNVTDKIKTYLTKNLSKYDLVLVADYGHGFLSKSLIDAISKNSRYLAVNAQTNSGNSGFNYVLKYPRIDYACIDENEARLAAHDNVSNIKDVMLQLVKNSGIKKMAVTLGHLGSVSYGGGKKYNKNSLPTIPSFAHKITDTVGAGDAYLAISAPCAAAGFPIELLSFLGNVASAIAVGVVGHKTYISQQDLVKHLSYLLE